MDINFQQITFVGLPVGGTILALLMGILIPGMGPLFLGLFGFLTGGVASLLMFYVAVQKTEDKPVGQLEDAENKTYNEIEFTIHDAITDAKINEPVELELDHPFLDEKRQLTVNGGTATVELLNLTWNLSVFHDACTTEMQLEADESKHIDITLPPKRLLLQVQDQQGQELDEVSIDVEAVPVDNTNLIGWTEGGYFEVELPVSTQRVDLSVSHNEYAAETAEVILEGQQEGRAKVQLTQTRSDRETGQNDKPDQTATGTPIEADAETEEKPADTIQPSESSSGTEPVEHQLDTGQSVTTNEDTTNTESTPAGGTDETEADPGAKSMVDVEATTKRYEEVTLVSVTVRNTMNTTQRVELKSQLEGPVWPPKFPEQPAPAWNETIWQGIVAPGETIGIGFASPAEPVNPPVVMTSTDRATKTEDKKSQDVHLAELDEWKPPIATVKNQQ